MLKLFTIDRPSNIIQRLTQDTPTLQDIKTSRITTGLDLILAVAYGLYVAESKAGSSSQQLGRSISRSIFLAPDL
jgi:hypothetical protein